MKRKIKVDASAFKESSCLLRFKRIVLDGLKEPMPWNDVQYGSAFHMFVATMARTNGDAGEATKKALEIFSKPCEIRKKHLTVLHLQKTCYDYWEHFHKTDNAQILSVDNIPLVEQNFEILLYEDDYNEVYLCGTIDKMVKFVNGIYAIGDYKTHSLWSASKNGNWIEGAKAYFQQYELSSQLLTYRLAIRLQARRNPDSIFATLDKSQVGTFIDGVFLSSNQDTRFMRSDVKIWTDEQITLFHNLALAKAKAICELPPDYNIPDGLIHGACSENQFKCKFFQLCAAPDDITRGHLIRNNYIVKSYNPLEFGK